MDTPGASTDRDEGTGAQAVLAAGRWRLVAGLVVVVVLGVGGFFGWKWFRWTRSDAYQLQRIHAQAPALVDSLEGTESLDRWLAAAALANDWRASLRRAAAIKDPYHRLRALGRLTSTLDRAGLADAAQRTRELTNESARMLESSAARKTDPAQRIEGTRAVALALVDARLFEPALAVIRLAAEDVRGTPAEATLATARGQIAEEFAVLGQAEQALDLAAGIENAEVRRQTLIAVAVRLEKAGLADRAREAARRALDVAEKETDPVRRWPAISAAAIAMARVGLADDAEAAAARIEPSRFRFDAYVGMVEACAAHHSIDAATHAAEGAREAAFQFRNPEQRWGFLLHLARLLTRPGLTGPPVAPMAPGNERAQLLTIVSLKDIARDVATLAQETATQIPQEPARKLGLAGQLPVILADAGMTAEATEAALSALEAARRVSGPGARAVALATAARSLAKAGQAGRAAEAAILARDTAMGIQDEPSRDRALAGVCVMLGDAGLGLELERTIAQQIQNPEYRYRAFEAFLIPATEANRTDEAAALAELARSAGGRIENPNIRSRAFVTVTRAQLRLRLLDEALSTAGRISDPVSHSLAMLDVARALARAGRLREAREAAEACDNPEHRLAALTTVLIELTRKRRPDLAAALEAIERPEDRVPGPLIDPAPSATR